MPMELFDVIRCTRVHVDEDDVMRVRMEIPLPDGIGSIWYKPDDKGLQGITDMEVINKLEDEFQRLFVKARGH